MNPHEIRFLKYQSLGNDFILLDWRTQGPIVLERTLSSPTWAQSVKSWCTRHVGIGADGILVLTKSGKQADARLLMFNADGSKGLLCLNGVRCAADYLAGELKRNQISVEMSKLLISCARQKHGSIAMLIKSTATIASQTIKIGPKNLEWYIVDVGNKHAIIFGQIEPESFRALAPQLGTQNRHFEGTNIELVRKRDVAHYDMFVYENGSGFTQACSSGALALCNLLVHLKIIGCDQAIEIAMPGGVLQASVTKENHISLIGTASRVFTGRLIKKEGRELIKQASPCSKFFNVGN